MAEGEPDRLQPRRVIVGKKPEQETGMEAIKKGLKSITRGFKRRIMGNKAEDETLPSTYTGEPLHKLPDRHEHLHPDFPFMDAYSLTGSDNPKTLFERMKQQFSYIKDVYGRMRHEDPIAAFCYDTLQRFQVMPVFYDSKISLDEFMLKCLLVTLPVDKVIPTECLDMAYRNGLMAEWEKKESDNNVRYFFLKAFHRAVREFADQKYHPPEEKDMTIKKPAFATDRENQENNYLYRVLDSSLAGNTSLALFSDYFPDRLEQYWKDRLDHVMPAGMQSFHLFRTPLYLEKLWQSFADKYPDFANMRIGDVLCRVIPHNVTGDLRVENGMTFLRNEEGEYDPEAAAVRNVILYAPFHDKEVYENFSDDMVTFFDTRDDMHAGRFDESEEHFVESDGFVNEQQLIMYITNLYDRVMDGAPLAEVLEVLAPGVHRRHLIRLNSEEPIANCVLLPRLRRLLSCAIKCIGDEKLVLFFRTLVAALHKSNESDWSTEEFLNGMTAAECLRERAGKCFGEQSEADYDHYSGIRNEQINRWNFLNEKSSQRDPSDREGWQQFSRRMVGWRMVIRDLVSSYLVEIFDELEIDITQHLITQTMKEVVNRLADTIRNVPVDGAFVALFPKKSEGVQLVRSPYLVRKT
jgi:hypothetical protein